MSSRSTNRAPNHPLPSSLRCCSRPFRRSIRSISWDPYPAVSHRPSPQRSRCNSHIRHSLTVVGIDRQRHGSVSLLLLLWSLHLVLVLLFLHRKPFFRQGNQAKTKSRRTTRHRRRNLSWPCTTNRVYRVSSSESANCIVSDGEASMGLLTKLTFELGFLALAVVCRLFSTAGSLSKLIIRTSLFMTRVVPCFSVFMPDAD
jgi:hypothetical protein